MVVNMLRRDRACVLKKQFSKLPMWQQKLIIEDMETAFENRIRVMAKLNRAVECGAVEGRTVMQTDEERGVSDASG